MQIEVEKNTTLSTPMANILWSNGQPYSKNFQDIYFSTENGLLETEYVFIEGNDLLKRWNTLKKPVFTVAETGFGTGLNFLLTAKLWLDNMHNDALLHFISVEKHPLTLNDITTCCLIWPELETLSHDLLIAYENLIHQKQDILLYRNKVKLTLLIGDATECLKKINLTQTNEKVDAWYLDGFSPAKNAEMWHPMLFEQMAKLSYPNSTFSTFTSAGNVRRNLSEAGFKVYKRAGFRKKREMLIGKYSGIKNHA